MKISLSAEQYAALVSFLSSFEDCESLTEREYVLDLYDIEHPISIDLILEGDAIAIEGAAALLYDEAMSGWYMGDRIELPDIITLALAEAGAFAQ